jgi:hypothetical protein
MRERVREKSGAGEVMLCAAHFSYEISYRDRHAYFGAVVRFPYEISCFGVRNFRIRFSHKSS